ncbi:hypothetical protein B0H10DRAFT_1943059 [Mycena sp. CBHHK59/15]|nr:hypothetical protein B0H10DRAFT_1943059 [Mycena sp. CBHHK59/15]
MTQVDLNYYRKHHLVLTELPQDVQEALHRSLQVPPDIDVQVIPSPLISVLAIACIPPPHILEETHNYSLSFLCDTAPSVGVDVLMNMPIPTQTLIAGARATVVQHWLDGKESLRIELGGLHYHFPLWIVDLWHQMVHTVIPAVNTWKDALVWLDQPAFKPFVGTIRGLHRHLSRLPWFGTIPALGAASLVPKATLTTFLSRSWFSGDQIDVCLLMLQALWEQNPTQAATTKIIDTNLMYSIVLRFRDHTAGVVYDLDNSGSLSALGAVLREGRDFGGIGHVGGNHWVAAGTAQGQEALLYGDPARKMPDWELTSAIRWFCLQYIPTISLESAITLESSYQQLEIDWWQCGLLSLNTQNKTSSL